MRLWDLCKIELPERSILTTNRAIGAAGGMRSLLSLFNAQALLFRGGPQPSAVPWQLAGNFQDSSVWRLFGLFALSTQLVESVMIWRDSLCWGAVRRALNDCQSLDRWRAYLETQQVAKSHGRV